MAIVPTCHVLNLQKGLGGAEVYTMFFARALRAAGCRVELYVSPEAEFWAHLVDDGVALHAVGDDIEALEKMPSGGWIVTHAPVSAAFLDKAARSHWLTGFCHMPLRGRSAGALARYHLVYGVSAYVLSTLGPAGIKAWYPEPVYGVAEFTRGYAGAAEPIRARSPYFWDRRKARDRALSLFAAAGRRVGRPGAEYKRLAGTALGIVSNIGPIKQFDVLFTHIAVHIARHPGVHLEVFGKGGYRSVADFKNALGPMRGRTRFWGHQDHPQNIYPQLDFLMTGLPEKEALGLNVIEAQACGTPVLAVDAPPFTETVRDGVSGYMYPDPRNDGGAGFAGVFARALQEPRPDPRSAPDHLAVFSRPAFDGRIARLVEHAGAHLRGRPAMAATPTPILH